MVVAAGGDVSTPKSALPEIPAAPSPALVPDLLLVLSPASSDIDLELSAYPCASQPSSYM